MLVKVIGIDSKDNRYSAIVEGDSIEDGRTELIECMGIEAHSNGGFVNELLDIGFDVYTKIKGVDLDTIPIVEIAINLNEDDNIF